MKESAAVLLLSAMTIVAVGTTPASPQGVSRFDFDKAPGARSILDEKAALIQASRKNPSITVQDGPYVLNPPSGYTPPVAVKIPQTREAALEKSGEIPTAPFKAAAGRIGELFDPRIIGGRPAKAGEFPWQVVLIVGETADNIRSPFCGGSIVQARWIVTAAHCLFGIEDPKQVDIISGSLLPKFAGEGQRIQVKNFRIHPEYVQKTFENDIALLELESDIEKGGPVDLPPDDLVIPDNAAATVSGWGAVTAYGSMTDRLLKADVPIVSNAVCNEPSSYSGTVKSTMLCAGYREGGFDACQGDSGGPLVAKVNGSFNLVGVVSWGRGCALRLKYGVYTRVQDYTGWIKTVMK